MATKKAKKETTAVEEQLATNDIDDFLQSALDIKVTKLSEMDSIPYWFDSGSFALNWTISNDFFKGIPGTKVILVSGEEARGKTLITDVWLGKNIEYGGASYKVDVEDASSGEFAGQVFGSADVAGQVRIISPDTLKAIKKSKGDMKKIDPTDLVITVEKFTGITNKLIDFQLSRGEKKNKSIMMSVDSISQMISDKELTDISEGNDKRDMTAQQKMRGLFRAINQKMRGANFTLVGIAHKTTDINIKFGSNKVTSAKGSGFKFANSLEICAVSTKDIVDKKTSVAIGTRLKFKTEKNRIKFKGRSCYVDVYFATGIDRYSGLMELLYNYGLVTASAKPNDFGILPDTATFTYVKKDGTEIKIKSGETKKAIESNGGDDLLIEMNERLNTVYENALRRQGLSETELLDTVDADDEDSNLDNIDFDESDIVPDEGELLDE